MVDKQAVIEWKARNPEASYREIAKQFGCRHSYIWKVLNKRKIEPPAEVKFGFWKRVRVGINSIIRGAKMNFWDCANARVNKPYCKVGVKMPKDVSPGTIARGIINPRVCFTCAQFDSMDDLNGYPNELPKEERGWKEA